MIIGYINSVAYVQHKIDKILYSIVLRVRAYVNDIICKAKSLLDLFEKLHILFDIFLEYNIYIKLTKFFFNYPDIELLR